MQQEKYQPLSLYEKIFDLVMRAIHLIFQGRVGSGILCYHSVSSDAWRFSTTPQQLREHFAFIQNHSRFVSVSEMVVDPKQKGVAITFDDGYQNLLDNALPICTEFGVKPTVFVLGDKDAANREQLGNDIPLLSEKEILTLHNNGWEIGFHTKTHSDLFSLSATQLEDEIVLAKKNLENRLGISIKYFAYPRGAYSKVIVSAVKEAGFEAAFTINAGTFHTTDLNLVPRIPLEGNTPLPILHAQLSALGMTVNMWLLSLLRFKARITRLSRYNPTS